MSGTFSINTHAYMSTHTWPSLSLSLCLSLIYLFFTDLVIDYSMLLELSYICIQD